MPRDAKLQVYMDPSEVEDLRHLAAVLNCSMSTLAGLMLRAQLSGHGDQYMASVRIVAAKKGADG